MKKKDEEIKEKLLLPHDCYLILTEKCNLRCKHCYGDFGDNRKLNELSGDEWTAIIEELAKQKIFYLNISGGEPTMHPHFSKIINALIKNEMYFILTTNGIMSNKNLESILNAKKYLIGIKVSLDGHDHKTHGFLRKTVNGLASKELFTKTIETIKVIKKNDIPLTIATCLHKKNIKDLDKLKEIILELKPTSWFISTISTNGRSAINKDIFASDKELNKNYWKKLRVEMLKNNIFVNYIDMDYANQTKADSNFYYSCPAAKTFCEISSEGLVTPCPLARTNISEKYIKFENIKEKNIYDIWNGEAFEKFRKLSTEGCLGCICKNECDRCIPQSIEWFEDPSAPTPFCVKNAESLGLIEKEKWQQKLSVREKEFKRR